MNYKNTTYILMLNFIFIFSCMHVSTLHAAKAKKVIQPRVLPAQQSPNDLILILDPHGQETISAPGAMVKTFLMALEQKAAPIIVTKEVCEIFCYLVDILGTEKIKTMREALATKNAGTVQRKAQAIYDVLLPGMSAKDKEKIINAITVPIISIINLDNQNWQVYIHKAENLVLLIPQEYIVKNKQGDIKKCGFALDSLIKISDVSPKKLSEFLKKRESRLKEGGAFMNALESLFVRTKAQPVLRITQQERAAQSPAAQAQAEKERQEVDLVSWNIYMTGHGGAAEKADEAELQKELESAQKNIKEQQEKLESEKKKEVELKELIKKQEQDLKTWVKVEELKRVIKSNKEGLKIFKHNFSAFKHNIEIFEQQRDRAQKELSQGITSGAIAGLSPTHFSRLMKFFDQKIKTSFVHYVTCFSGGINRAYLNDELKKLNVGFITSSEGIAENTVAIVSTSAHISAETGDWIFVTKQFGVFFELLNNFFGSTSGAASFTQAQKEKGVGKKEPFKAIMQSIVPGAEYAQNTPFIRFPSIGVFSALNIDEKVKVLTRSTVMAHELEDKAIDMSSTTIENIIIYPSRIGVTLNMGQIADKVVKKKALVLPAPAELSLSDKQICIFEKILFQERLSSFIFNCAVHNASQFKKRFLVKELACKDYKNSGLSVGEGKNIVIKNMVVLFSPTEPPAAKVAGDFQVCLEYNGEVYYGAIHIPSFEDAKNLFNLFEALKVAPAKFEKIKELAGNMLDLSDVALPKKPIAALASLAEQLDSSVEKIVVKPGALKEVLLKKQEDAEKQAQEAGQEDAPEVVNPSKSAKPDKKKIKKPVVSKKVVTPAEVLDQAGVDLKDLQDMLKKAVVSTGKTGGSSSGKPIKPTKSTKQDEPEGLAKPKALAEQEIKKKGTPKAAKPTPVKLIMAGKATAQEDPESGKPKPVVPAAQEIKQEGRRETVTPEQVLHKAGVKLEDIQKMLSKAVITSK